MVQDKNTTAQVSIWKCHIEKELKTAAEWENSWGFLKQGAVPNAKGMPQKGAAASSSTPALAIAGRSMLADSSKGGSSSVTQIGFDPRSRALSARMLHLPQHRYGGRQIITSHEIGWRPSIEKFGVSQHGVKRDPSIWPDY
eukprot:CAMPEP_0115094684 /NCGR_PEP_ID=MMETSP0227-20121206/28515_1 /TAXON_ID=89957 /ORGANISM="Polarella glacialis, Strain CCMP 1383" /LENGTH=140 /DNA_ID=CAMNT_0002487755 /DNA_START=203 /DNA_END=625 /DNA_ORIENTATION=-